MSESMSAKKACGGGEHDLQMGAELVGDGDPVGDQVTAGTNRGPQRGGLLGVPFQWAESAPVGAHHVGQPHVGHQPHVVLFSLVQRQLHGRARHDLPEVAPAVQQGGGSAGFERLDDAVGVDDAAGDLDGILADAQHAVRIMPHQVILDQRGGDALRRCQRCPGGKKHLDRDGAQAFGSDVDHDNTSVGMMG